MIGGAGIGELVSVGIGLGATCAGEAEAEADGDGQLGYACASGGSWLGHVAVGEPPTLADADALALLVSAGDAEVVGVPDPVSVGEAEAVGVEPSVAVGGAEVVFVEVAPVVSVGEAEPVVAEVSVTVGDAEASIAYPTGAVPPPFGLTRETCSPVGSWTAPLAVCTRTSTPLDSPTHIGLVPPRIARPFCVGVGALSSTGRPRHEPHRPVATDRVRTCTEPLIRETAALSQVTPTVVNSLVARAGN
jgi:hypothetical protein